MATAKFIKYQPTQYAHNSGTPVFTEKRLQDMSDNYFNSYIDLVKKTNSRQDLLDSLAPKKSSTNDNDSVNSSSFVVGGLSGIDDITKQAKDMAEFRLGLDFRGMDKAAQLRENESQANFGRTSKLTDQTFNWQRMINQDTEDARTQRNTNTLNRDREAQTMGIDQENFATRRAIGLASRRLGA